MLKVPSLAVSLFFWVPEALSHDDASEQSLLAETLEVLFARLLKKRNKWSVLVPPSLVDLFVEISRRSLNMTRRVSYKTHHL